MYELFILSVLLSMPVLLILSVWFLSRRVNELDIKLTSTESKLNVIEERLATLIDILTENKIIKRRINGLEQSKPTE